MSDLVKVEVDENGEEFVNARGLHNTLNVGRDFSNWIKGRIKKYKFVENEDFIVLAKSGENPLGGRPEVKYHVSTNMAKELAMIENNDVGRKVRKYFIECEKAFKKNHVNKIELENVKLKALVNNREKMLGEAIIELSKRAPCCDFGDISKSNGRHRTKYRRATFVAPKAPTQLEDLFNYFEKEGE